MYVLARVRARVHVGPKAPARFSIASLVCLLTNHSCLLALSLSLSPPTCATPRSLSSCATRPIGHILILESTDLSHVKSFLATDPIVQDLGCDVEDIPIYRWRHIKDYSLRIDDGRDGCPNVLLQMDRPAEELGGADLRSEVEEDKLEYLIRSRRVIAAGPIHLPTSVKDDPSSLPVGDLIFFNAEDRDDAVAFAENDPASQAGLYGDMRVYKYNNLDVTGKFVSKNLHTMGSSDGYYNRNLRMKDEMKEEGYPVDDSQTPWFNY